MTNVESLMQEAINFARKGQLNQAKEQFDKVISLKPNDHTMKAVIGSIYWDYKYYEEAFDHLFSIIEFRHSLDSTVKDKLLSRIMSAGLGGMAAMSDPENGMKIMALHQLALKLNDQQTQINFNMALFKMMMEPEWLERWNKMDWIGGF